MRTGGGLGGGGGGGGGGVVGSVFGAGAFTAHARKPHI